MFQLKTWFIFGTLCFGLIILGLVSLSIGSIELSFRDIFGLLIDPSTAGNEVKQLIFFESRLPRTLTALLVGAALAGSGVIFYYLAGNDLACPSLLGINYGVYFAIICGVILMATPSIVSIFVCGVVGGLVTGGIVYLITLRGGFSSLKLILVGQIISLCMYAACQLLFILAPTKVENLVINLNGSLANSSFTQFNSYAWLLLVTIFIASILIRKNYLLSLGIDVAQSIGLNTRFLIFILLGLILFISTISVVLVGPLLFFPLLAVQIGLLLASRHRPYLFLFMSLLVGALLLLGADVILRLIYHDWEAPLNIFIAVLGVPILIYRSKALR